MDNKFNMKKILYVANTDLHINLCHLPYLKYLKEHNYIIHVATNTDINIDYCDRKISIPITRSPYKLSNILAIKYLKKVIDKEKYHLIVVNTPMGAVVGRIAAISSRKKNNTKIVYIAHGFHFFKGCLKRNYILYYPVEKILSKYTDTIITLNEEDYNSALKHFNTNIEYIKGIGFDQTKLDKKLKKAEMLQLKRKLNLDNNYIITYIAEISKRKGQIPLLKILSKMNLDNIKILFVGNNLLEKKINRLLKKYQLENKVVILGFRNDISDILDISDLIISVSNQEGLPLNIMEAMYKNKNIIVSNCRGNRDLITNLYNGLVVNMNDEQEFINAVYKFKNHKYKNKVVNKKLALDYTISSVLNRYIKIFEKYLK